MMLYRVVDRFNITMNNNPMDECKERLVVPHLTISQRRGLYQSGSIHNNSDDDINDANNIHQRRLQ